MSDHVEFKPTFLGDVPSANETWVLAAITDSDQGLSVRRLSPEDLVRVFALPELQRGSEPWLKIVGELCERVTKLQGLMPEADLEDWSPVVELFHPDMNISDIQRAVARLLRVYALAERASIGNTGPGNELQEALHKTKKALWEGRPTQLEKDEAAKVGSLYRPDLVQESPPHPDDIAYTDALERGARRGRAAEALWQMLDDIDTLSDQIKPATLAGYTGFYQRALDIAKRRHEYLKSDGHKLTWSDQGTVEVLTNKYADLVDCIEHLAQGYSFESKFPEHESHAKLLRELFDKAFEALRAPVPMLLHCPMCKARHLDEGEFATKKHHTHACQECGHCWRPAVVATVGVQFLPGFKNEPASEGLVGHRARCLANGIEGIIESYDLGTDKYVLVNDYPSRLKLSRHEFMVLE